MLSFKHWLLEKDDLIYLQIGHDEKSTLWIWRKNKLETKPTGIGTHIKMFTPNFTWQWQGRYDPEKNMASIINITEITIGIRVPRGLVNALRKKFGDGVIFRPIGGAVI